MKTPAYMHLRLKYSIHGVSYLVLSEASLTLLSFRRTMNPNDEFGECTRVVLLKSKPLKSKRYY